MLVLSTDRCRKRRWLRRKAKSSTSIFQNFIFKKIRVCRFEIDSGEWDSGGGRGISGIVFFCSCRLPVFRIVVSVIGKRAADAAGQDRKERSVAQKQLFLDQSGSGSFRV
jgi:hypothetical protein